jgi:hypothetical protein
VLKITGGARRELGLKKQKWPAREVNGRRRACLIHRNDGVAVPGYSRSIAKCLVQRLAQHEAGVLDRVMGAGGKVAVDLHGQVKSAVPRQQIEHVIEESDAGRALTLTLTVEIEA